MRVRVALPRVAAVLMLLAHAAAAEAPAHVGSAACSGCHVDATTGWAASDHAAAWTAPGETTVLGDFDDVRFEHGGQVTSFLREGSRYLIETEGPDGQRRAYEVLGVAGIDPLQQYLLSPAPGRLQVYDIGWDTRRGQWFPVFPGPPAGPGDGFHWTGPYKSWEARCAQCHATGYSRNYDPTTDRYAPRMAETGVGCEACHGPGAAHLDWARTRQTPPAGLTATGLTVDLAASQATEVMGCLSCHSRREAMQDGNPLPGSDYHHAFSLTLLREGIYHPNGAIQDEVFEGGSFLQSRMHARGLRCSTCHEPHSATLRLEGDAVCTQCHSPAGNPDYPSLIAKRYDTAEHHFHPEGEGARCVSCHMIQRTYMGVDRRRDHYFRVPRPDLAATGSPDACTDCHADRGPDWAAAELTARFPDSPHRGPDPAPVIAAARLAPERHVAALLDLAEWTGGSGILRASALDLLAEAADASSAGRVQALLADPDPLVRAAAAGALRGLPADERLAALEPLLRDPARTVREAAAKALPDAPAATGTPAGTALAQARAEWQQALALRLDFPETHLQIGGAALTRRDFAAARDAFRQAAAMDPQLVVAWVMAVRIAAALGDTVGARQTLSDALAANPGEAALRALLPQL